MTCLIGARCCADSYCFLPSNNVSSLCGIEVTKKGNGSPVKHLRKAAVGGALPTIILMLALTGMVAVSFKEMIEGNRDMHNRYQDQMALEGFPVALSNLLISAQPKASLGSGFDQLDKVVEAFRSHLARAAAIRHLDPAGKSTLRRIGEMVEEAIGLARIDADDPYLSDFTIIARDLIWVAQKQVSELNVRMNENLANGIDEQRNRIFKLLLGICASIACLAFSFFLFRRRLMASLREMVRTLGRQLGQTAEGIVSTVDKQSELANEDNLAIDRIKKKMSEMANDRGQLIQTTEDVQKITAAMMRVAESGLKSAEETAQYLKSISQTISGVEQGYLQTEDQDAKVQRLMDAMKDVSEEVHLVRLNASIETSNKVKRHAMIVSDLRNLDIRLIELAGEMESVISEVREATRSSLEHTSSGMKEVPSGETIIKRSGDTLQQLQHTTAKVNESVKDIADISHRQHEFGKKVSELANELSESISEHSEHVRRFRDHAFTLNKMTDEMKESL